MASAICRDKIEGMFLGVAIGDALGMPVETLSLEAIRQKYGRIEEYLEPTDHEQFAGKLKAGMWTDATQLTLVVSESLIAKGRIDLDDLAQRHVKALEKTDLGWCKSTRNSVKKSGKGTHWSKSGFPEKQGDGIGNGVVMKIAPVASYIAAHYERPIRPRLSTKKLIDLLANLTCMTHHTRIAFSATMTHAQILNYCLLTATGFSQAVFKSRARMASAMGDRPVLDPGGFETDRLLHRMHQLEKEDWTRKSAEEISDSFGQGSGYVYNSLPFSYAFFLKAPDSIETLYEVVSAGGDTDSNGSIVGGMLGALNGTKIFPQHLVDGLWQKDRILATARRFCKKFMIPN